MVPEDLVAQALSAFFGIKSSGDDDDRWLPGDEPAYPFPPAPGGSKIEVEELVCV